MEVIILAFILPLLFAVYLLFSSKPKNKRYHDQRRDAPIAAGYLPILGHLHKLGGSRPLWFMAEVHGPIFTMWVGKQRTVVVSSSDLVKECFTTNDKALPNRMHNAAACKCMSYNYAMFGFAGRGTYWMEERRMAARELLSPRRLQVLKHVRMKEIDLCIRELYVKWVGNYGEPIMVDNAKWIGNLEFNNTVMSIAGKRDYFGANVGDEKEVREFRDAILMFFHLAGKIVVSDAIPWLESADIGGHIKEMKDTLRGCDLFLSRWLEENRLKMVAGINHLGDEDFIDIMLSTMEKYKVADHHPDTVVKANLVGLLLGGVVTSAHALVWALALLTDNPRALEKAQEELTYYKNRMVDESDINNLKCLQVIINEAMQLYPTAPAVPRMSVKDCQIDQYHVPASLLQTFGRSNMILQFGQIRTSSGLTSF